MLGTMTEVDMDRVPQHVAIIMDGNGRWATLKGENRIFGHMNGSESVRSAIEASIELGVEYLTLYAFSTENWSRPAAEVNALMDLLVKTLVRETDDLYEKGVSLRTIGDLSALPEDCQKILAKAQSTIPEKCRLQLTLALNYSSKWEITEAVKAVVAEGISSEDIEIDTLAKYLQTADMPDPELMIRTSGEHRISNFMLWQLAYAEFHFTPVLWPDFRKEHFLVAIQDYQNRDRRFGGISQHSNT
jgi:undecaprenyl diphosphate synthase